MKPIYFYFRFLWFCFFKVNISAVVDVSGSIDPKSFKRIDNLLRLATNFSTVHVILVDHEIFSCYAYNPLYPLVKNRILGHRAAGGSSIDSAANYVNSIPRADGLLIFSDGYVPAPSESPIMDTLWVIAPGGAVLDKSYPGKVLYSN